MTPTKTQGETTRTLEGPETALEAQTMEGPF